LAKMSVTEIENEAANEARGLPNGDLPDDDQFEDDPPGLTNSDADEDSDLGSPVTQGFETGEEFPCCVIVKGFPMAQDVPVLLERANESTRQFLRRQS
jgi:hypothetical protein